MTPKSILRDLKAKVELDAQIQDSPTVVTGISGDETTVKTIVMRAIEGKIVGVEVTAKVIDTIVRTDSSDLIACAAAL